MEIFLARNNEQAGPYTLEQVNDMLGNGEVILTDLAWHTGLEKWQPLGELTAGQNYYTGSPAPNFPPQERWAQPPQTSTATNQGVNHNNHGNNPYTTPNSGLVSQTSDDHSLAPIGKRLAAVCIDQLLLLLILLPALPYVSASTGDFAKLDTPEKAFAFYEKLIGGLPITVQGFIGIAMIVLFILQVYLLVKRGQSLGKILLGIRIVDIDSLKVPSLTNVFLLRTLLTNISYNFPFVGIFIFIADSVMLFFAKDNRTLHDQIAKTKVVVAADEQLEK